MPRYITCFALTLAALGGGCSSPAATDTSRDKAPSTSSATTPTVHNGRPIEIVGNDTMKFSVTEISAKPGEKLSITLVNLGTTPKFSMGHNWVLVLPMPDVQPFLTAAAEAVTTEYVPQGTQQDRILAATKLLGPNERDTVTFTAPTAPGRYDFFCTYPGHYQVGMRGVLIVG